MKKLLLLFSLFAWFTLPGVAQKGDLMVKNGDKGLYLEHKVVAKESFFSVGRLYNVHPKAIADYNNVDMNKGLFIDQKIKIPLTDTNFTQQGNSGTPVYYRIDDKDGLLKISKSNRNVSLDNLRFWNNLSSDEIKKGQKLIVGFLLSKEMVSITISRNKDEKIVMKPESKEAVNTEKPEIKAEEKKSEVSIEEKKPEIKEELKKTEFAVVKEPVKPAAPDPGYFKSHFELQVRKFPVSKEVTVTAGIFKTASGWQDAKYYLLIDAVQPGTIIRVINPTNNNVIYAKVLGMMSGIRQNEGLIIRLSNAAATALGVTEQDKFIVKISY